MCQVSPFISKGQRAFLSDSGDYDNDDNDYYGESSGEEDKFDARDIEMRELSMRANEKERKRCGSVKNDSILSSSVESTRRQREGERERESALSKTSY